MNIQMLAANDISSLFLAVLFSLVGCYLATDFMSRTQKGNSLSRLNWLFIVAIIYGASSWASMTMIFQSYDATFDPSILFGGLLASLLFAVSGFAITLRKESNMLTEVGGAVIGLGNIVCWYIVAASSGIVFQSPLLDLNVFVLSSVALSVIGFSVATRTSRRISHVGAAAIMVAAIGLVAFGMRFEYLGLTPLLDFARAGKETVGPSVVVIMSAVFGAALAAYNIEHQSRLSAIAALKNLSVIDSLTGLSNRAALKAHIAKLTETTDRNTTKFAVLAFNLNRFRLINDVHGSEAGDLILKTVASRLTAALAPNEFIARVGGDEFYAVKAGIHRKADAEAFADKLLEIVRESIHFKASKLDITARIGGSLFPNNSDDVEELIGQADIAMCRSGTTRQEEVIFFDPAIDKARRDMNALAIDLRKAIDDGEFEIYYQPQHDVSTRALIGFEALIRWNHPLKGMISPADFIPLAEKTGMINEIGAWVIRESCRQAARWGDSIKVAVNVSANQIMRNDLPDIVEEALASSGIDPSRLELEITESGIINDERHAFAILNRLKVLGCALAMDDFGTGFSSLSTFKKFPFDKIKIDRSFISDLATNKQSFAIVCATIGVGLPLGIKVLAEGVEDEEQLAILADKKCHEVQGYLFGRPVQVHEADAILREQRMTVRAQPEAFGGKIIEFKASSR